jgi:HKD family nuclease
MMETLLYENETVDRFRSELSRARGFHFAFGLLSNHGLKEVEDALTRCLKAGGHGRVLIGVDMPTHPDAIRQLRKLEIDYKKQLELRRFQSGKRHIFHVKLAIFENRNGKQTAILGSSNLTRGGLIGNYEANVFLDNKESLGELLDYFDQQFEGAYARQIDDTWFDNYLKWWKEREKAERKLQQLREKVRKLPAKRRFVKTLPKRIKGFAFAFTGRIDEWPRERKLYPTVRRLGGQIVFSADSITNADCLVHGEILAPRKDTKKLRGAIQNNIPRITEEEFLKILEHEQKQRRRG